MEDLEKLTTEDKSFVIYKQASEITKLKLFLFLLVFYSFFSIMFISSMLR